MAIVSCLVDTNVLRRLTRRSDPQHNLIDTALLRLALEGTSFHYTHQNIAELWNVMTRPLEHNGFGLTVEEAEREVRAIENGMNLLPDSEAVYREWRRIVLQHSVSGIQCTMHVSRQPCTSIGFPISLHLTSQISAVSVGSLLLTHTEFDPVFPDLDVRDFYD